MRPILTAFILLTMGGPALAQASVDVEAGPLRGSAHAGAQADADHSDHHARSDHSDRARTDDTSACDHRGVSVHSANGSASASVSSSGGNSVVAGGGSPGSHTEYFGCDSPHATPRRNQ
jgi:hypothetical protein